MAIDETSSEEELVEEVVVYRGGGLLGGSRMQVLSKIRTGFIKEH